MILFSFTLCAAQSIGGVNTTGTFGNEIIEGKIFFPADHRSAMRPVVKLQSDSSPELTTVADSDGSFRLTRLRPDAYRIVVNGGDEFENAYETLSIGVAGGVPAQGNPFDYSTPVVYPVQIYLKLKGSHGSGSRTTTADISANVPQRARTLFKQGVESARLGQSAKALDQFKGATQQAPTFALAYHEMGLVYLTLGQANKAAAAFAEAIRLGRDDFVAHLNYGIALLNVKKFTEAEQQLRQALEKNANAPTIHYYLGLALMHRDQLEAAQSEFKTSVANSNDGIASAHKYLGGIYWRQKQYPIAADELEKYVELAPQAADVAQIRETIKELRSKGGH